MIFASWIVADVFSKADFNRIIWIKAHDILVFDINTWDAISCGWDQVAVVKTDLAWSRRNRFIPINLVVAKTQVPFSDDSGVVTGILQY